MFVSLPHSAAASVPHAAHAAHAGHSDCGGSREDVAGMFCRVFAKCKKCFIIVLVYILAFNIISYMINYKGRELFIARSLQLGEKYVFMYVESDALPMMSDADAARVFAGCGRCVLTNNRGFLPMSEYDALLTHGRREPRSALEPSKCYMLRATDNCIRNKLVECRAEHEVTSCATNKSYQLCELCHYLHK